MRCATCLGLHFEARHPKRTSSAVSFDANYHETVGALRESVSQGCHFCTLVLAGLNSHGLSEGKAMVSAPVLDDQPLKLTLYANRSWNKEQGTSIKQDGATMTLATRRFVEGGGSYLHEVRYKINTTPPPASPLHPLLPHSTPDPHTGSKPALSLIRNWLSHCAAHHGTTCAPLHPVSLPTRLLDVTTTTPLLIEPPPGTLGRYLALSHCWGTNPLITTTTSNLQEHLTTGLPLSSLPPTFRDAIVTTRELGYSLLWIDSLCILQDSHADWAREAARMGTYFSECEMVLAAAHAAHSGEGMYRERDAWGHQPWRGGVRLPGAAVESAPGQVTGWPAREEEVTLVREIGWGQAMAVGKGPLDGRAWTMQEEWLAQRVARWEWYQVSWVCKGGKGCEGWQGMVDGEGEGNGERWARGGDRWVRTLGAAGKGAEKRELYMGWYRTVEEYTTRAITKQFDILPAIGGLASRFQELVADRYVAGLWERDLHQGLLWRIEGPIQPGEQRFRAPSWSWASVNLTSIEFGNIPNPQYGSWKNDWFQVDEVTTRLASTNTYGEVDGGTLKITGYLRELEMAGASVAGGQVYEIRRNALQNPETGETLGNVFLDYPRLSTDATLRVWCVPVVHAGDSAGSLSSIGLAMVPTGLVEAGEFKRIGLAKITNMKWDRDFFPSGGKQSFCIV